MDKRKKNINAQLAQKKPVSAEDKVWLDEVGNLVDKVMLVESLAAVPDLNEAVKNLNEHQRNVYKWKSFADLAGVLEDERLSLSKGWLTSFMSWTGLKSFKCYSEPASAKMKDKKAECKRIWLICAEYEPKDIYNMDKTGLFYEMPPDHGLANKKHSRVKGNKCIRVENFKPNMTFYIQLNDAGIICCFKAHYWSSYIQCTIDHYDLEVVKEGKLRWSKRIRCIGNEESELQSNAVTNIVSLTAMVEEVEMRPQRQKMMDSDEFFPDLAAEADKQICQYESPIWLTASKVIDVDTSSPLPDDLPLDNTMPKVPQASKRDWQPSHLPTPEVKKRWCTGALEEFQVVPQPKVGEASSKKYTGFCQWQLGREKKGELALASSPILTSSLELQFQIPAAVQTKLMEAPNVSGIHDEVPNLLVNPSKRNSEPKEVVPATATVSIAAKQVDKIICQAYAIKAEEIEEVKKAHEELCAHREAFQTENNEALNNVMKVVDNLLEAEATLEDLRSQEKFQLEEKINNLQREVIQFHIPKLDFGPSSSSLANKMLPGFKRLLNNKFTETSSSKASAFTTLQRHVKNEGNLYLKGGTLKIKEKHSKAGEETTIPMDKWRDMALCAKDVIPEELNMGDGKYGPVTNNLHDLMPINKAEWNYQINAETRDELNKI
ncbi:hypothetical protein F5146DRAFT_1006953 [Armillaria mellea]|nr:hypothetical protein F5146DRAFT_1006953 [Armillaria mellea]